jgi:hypothetical protein
MLRRVLGLRLDSGLGDQPSQERSLAAALRGGSQPRLPGKVGRMIDNVKRGSLV